MKEREPSGFISAPGGWPGWGKRQYGEEDSIQHDAMYLIILTTL